MIKQNDTLEKVIIILTAVLIVAAMLTTHSVLTIRTAIIAESAERQRLDAEYRERMLEVAESHGVWIVPEVEK